MHLFHNECIKNLKKGYVQTISHWGFRVKRKKMASREEELQKKREEAERKARRGEIDPTHEFTFQVPTYVYYRQNFKKIS